MLTAQVDGGIGEETAVEADFDALLAALTGNEGGLGEGEIDSTFVQELTGGGGLGGGDTQTGEVVEINSLADLLAMLQAASGLKECVDGEEGLCIPAAETATPTPDRPAEVPKRL